MAETEKRIDAAPTKKFFIEMLTRDIGLEQAVLDLIDNSVDGAKRMVKGGDNLVGRAVKLTFSQDRFRLVDNCGGFDQETARNYAFRFGRPSGAAVTPNSIGQFGIGMKRALFKFGHHFIVRSATPADAWAVDVEVDEWEVNDDWHFEWADFGPLRPISSERPGTEIRVDRLRSSVAARFGSRSFANTVMDLIKSKHRQFIAKGMSIRVNGVHLHALDVYLLFGEAIQPGVDNIILKDEGETDVLVTIKVGLGASSPKDSGWYVICNGRVVLESDRSPVTGWGNAEAQAGQLLIPSFHNQFARFRGIATFDSIDSSRVPWTTTKNDIDQDSTIWARAYPRMVEMMRPVIDFLNEVAEDIDENTSEASPLFQVVTQTPSAKADSIRNKATFVAPHRGDRAYAPRTAKIQYSRPLTDIAVLKDALGVSSAKAVGERTFDLILKRQRD